MPKPPFNPNAAFQPADKPAFDPKGDFTPVSAPAPEQKPNPFQTANAQEDKAKKAQPGLLDKLFHPQFSDEEKSRAAQIYAQRNDPNSLENKNTYNELLGNASPVSGAGALVSGAAGLASKGLGAAIGFIPGVSKYARAAKGLVSLLEAAAPEAEGAAAKVASAGESAAPKASSSLAEAFEASAPKRKIDPFTKTEMGAPKAAAPVKTPPKIDPFSKTVKTRADIPQE